MEFAPGNREAAQQPITQRVSLCPKSMNGSSLINGFVLAAATDYSETIHKLWFKQQHFSRA